MIILIYMVRLKVGQKVLLLFVVVALLPLLAFDLLLLNIVRAQIRSDAYKQQQLLAEQTAERVDNFLANKVNVLIFQSQTDSTRNFKQEEASINLASMIKQDRDLQKVALVNEKGKEIVVINQQGLVKKHSEVSTSDAFKATTFLAGKEYIGPVNYSEAGKPSITIAVPLISFTEQQDLSNLSTAEFGTYRSPEDIKGVLVADYNLSDLWDSVLSTEIGSGGYAYVIDDKGNLIAHPDDNFLTEHQNLADVHQVEHFLKGDNDVHESVSETGESVISTSEPITRSNWAVVVQQPTATVLSSITAFYRASIVIFLVLAALAVMISLLFRRQILKPVKQLAAGAARIGKGDFDYHIETKTNDELGELAESFNNMGRSLDTMVTNLQAKNITLASEQKKVNSILQSINEGIVALSRDGQIISMNRQAAKWVNPQIHNPFGQNLASVFRFYKEGQPLKIDISKAGNYQYDDILLAHNDQVSYLQINVTVVEQRELDIGAIITIHDLTANQELENMKIDFVAIAAHELRTPLTVIKGYLNLLNNDALTQLSVMNIENLQRAIIGSDQLGRLINNLLNVSRIERGQLQVSFSKVDVAELVYRIVGQQQVTARVKNQKLTYEGVHKNIFIVGDASALTEVINNFISNALKYSESSTHIDVAITKQDSEMVKVSVKDEGPGIPNDAMSKLFTKFYRVQRTLTSGSRGTGLGLYIAKTIIDLHHGDVGVESEVGKGSTFYFTLPLFDEIKHAHLISKTKEFVGSHGWITKRSHR